MTREVFEKVRDIDHLVLQHIQDGYDDVHQISQDTQFDSKKIGYSFNKLEKHGLLHVEHPGGMTEKIVDGQKRVFRKPRTAQLTKLATQYLEQANPVENHGDVEENPEDLERKVENLEDRIIELEDKLEIFRKQILRQRS